MGYSDAEEQTLISLNIIASVCSFLGASFIIANYCVFAEFRQNIAFKLILFVAVGDIINSVGNFMGYPESIHGVCVLQGIITQFGDLVSFGWVTAIAWVIYTVITRDEPPTKEDVQNWYKWIHVVIWPCATILTILPLTTGSYGPAGGLCWITYDVQKGGEIWRAICFYLPLWGSIIYVSFVYCRVWNRLTASESPSANTTTTQHSSGNVKVPSTTNITNPNESTEDVHASKRDSVSVDNPRMSSSDVVHAGSSTAVAMPEDAEAPKSGGTLQRIKFYPFVLFGCYFFATIRRLTEFAIDSNDAPFILAALQVFFSALLGTFNALLYGLTPAVRQKDREWIRQKCGRGQYRLSSQPMIGTKVDSSSRFQNTTDSEETSDDVR